MVNILYSIIDILCIIILAFVLFQNEKYKEIGKKQKYLKVVLILTILFCLVDAFWGAVASHTILNSSYLILATTFFYVFTCWCSQSWLRFILAYVGIDENTKYKLLIHILIIIPFIVLVVFLLVNLRTGLLFYIENGEYKRSTSGFILIIYAGQYAYLLSSLVLSIFAAFRKSNDTANVRKAILFFSIVPIISGVFQLYHPEIPCYAMGYMLACFILFVFDVLSEREIAEGKKLELKQKQILDKCNTILLNNSSPQKNIDILLSLMCNYYDADRTFLMEYEDDISLISCTSEYCHSGIKSKKEEMQKLSSSEVKLWTDAFANKDDFYINNVFDFIPQGDELRMKMRAHGVMSVIVSPFKIGGKLIGLIGFDNPRTSFDDFSIIRTVSVFINSEVMRREQLEKEKKTSGAVLMALADDYSSVYYVNLQTDELKPYRLDSKMRKRYQSLYDESITYRAAYELYVNDVVYEEDQKEMRNFGSPDSIRKRLSGRKNIRKQYRCTINGKVEYFQAKWVKVDAENEQPTAVILGIANIDENIRNLEIINAQKKQLESTKQELDSAIAKAVKAQKDSQIDSLTGLFNKVSGQQLISEYLIEKSTEEKYSLLFIDIDKFKVFNDTYGHLVGDEILINVSEAIKAKCRQNDVAVRFGGDEFVILLKNVQNSEPAVRKAKLIQKELEKISEGHPYNLTCSIGIVVTDTINLYDAIAKADDSLYAVKESTRNSIRVFGE